jgi:protoporphyrinogen oxidase
LVPGSGFKFKNTLPGVLLTLSPTIFAPLIYAKEVNQKKAVIIGAGPAGLTAAYELVHKTGIKPVIFEASGDIGGISKTVNYKGNRIDIGGHRFFSKSDRVMQWWLNILPLQESEAHSEQEIQINYQNKSKSIHLPASGPDPEKTDRVMLIRNRLSRIFYLRSFFDYPVKLNANTIRKLGVVRIGRIGMSYIKARLFPIKEVRSLEDFFINRFGKELYLTFFKDYTEKVWGARCSDIGAEWGAQRIKGLSVSKALAHAVKSIFSKGGDLSQKSTETSLIEHFMYPKLGPGQMWEEVASQVKAKGAELHLRQAITGINIEGNKVRSVNVRDLATGSTQTVEGDYFFSTMPVKDLVNGMTPPAPEKVREIANGLVYRDFITVGILLKKLKIREDEKQSPVTGLIADNWIYVQEKDVKVGRLQLFNNWSPYLVKDPGTVWMGMEYFCNEGDLLWEKTDEELKAFAAMELEKIGMIDKADVLDSVVIRMPKTYPAYFGTYDQFGIIREFTDSLENLFLVGRNGMHRYNNQDHSMLTAMTAVENIMNGVVTKDNLWEVNTEEEYHESK